MESTHGATIYLAHNFWQKRKQTRLQDDLSGPRRLLRQKFDRIFAGSAGLGAGSKGFLAGSKGFLAGLAPTSPQIELQEPSGWVSWSTKSFFEVQK